MKQISKHPNYTISKAGQVWSKCYSKWLHGSKSHGYLVVTLDGHPHRVHRLILETYVGPCPKGMECRHFDGIRDNNKLENLCWGTRLENTQDAMRHGTHSCLQKHNKKQKLNETERKTIYYACRSGLYKTQELADAYYVSLSTILKIARKCELER